MSNEESDPGHHVLSARLMSIPTLLSLILFAFAFLPMASCNNEEVVVPARFLFDVAEKELANADNPGDYLAALVGAVPFTFFWTLSYWTCLPCLIVFPLLFRSPKWATRLWRSLILAYVCGTSCLVFTNFDTDIHGLYAFHVVNVSALLLWLWSSPMFAAIVGFGRRKSLRPRPVLFGGLWALTLSCFSAYLYLTFFESLLYGGRLAAVANVGLAFTLVVSARQASTNPKRFPRFNTLDLMITTFAFSIAIWRFYVVE